MNNENNLITAARFLELLKDPEAFSRLQHTPTTVMHDVRINEKETNITTGKASKRIQSIGLDNFTFLEGVTISHFDALSFHASGTNFLKGIRFENCSGGWLSMHGCKMTRFDGYDCNFKVLSLQEVEGPPATGRQPQHPLIEVSGFSVSECVSLEKVKAKELRLASGHTSAIFKAVAARTNDPLWALQLRMAGIPTYVNTEIAAEMLREGSFAARMHTAA